MVYTSDEQHETGANFIPDSITPIELYSECIWQHIAKDEEDVRRKISAVLAISIIKQNSVL